MTTTETPGTVRCASWARSEGLDPGGTAGTPGGFVVVDVPLPWPRDVGELPGLDGLRTLARAHGLRLQARVPVPGRPARVTAYRRPAGAGFTAWAADEAEVAEITVGEGVDGGDDPVAASLAALLARPCGPPAAPDETGEILVCTHGRRDTCCGSAGTALVTSLDPAGAAVAGWPVRRTSHTGGHRFAPTVIVLPQGTAWAFADADLIERVVTRSGPLDDVVARYRGCTGLASPVVQCVERAVLAEHGWALLDSARTGEELGGGRVRLRVVDTAGAEAVWEAEVVAGRTLTVPDCGRALDEARKTETERVVRSLRRVR